MSGPPWRQRKRLVGPVPEHLVDLYGNACDGCEINREHLVVAQLQQCVQSLRPGIGPD